MILQSVLPYTPWDDPVMSRLPGIQPLADRDGWVVVDEAYGAQMAERDRLIDMRRGDVFACDGGAMAAARELLAAVVSLVTPLSGFEVSGRQVRRPDGVVIDLDGDHPLVVAARLVQEDLCLLQKPEGAAEHVLTGAVLCFPASWTLAEKYMRPLVGIHVPVESYTDRVAAGVQRLFDAVRPERPMWRANAHLYEDPSLFHPRTEGDPRVQRAECADYLRSERQCILRLPQTGAVVFSIHTYLLRRGDLTASQQASLAAHLAAGESEEV